MIKCIYTTYTNPILVDIPTLFSYIFFGKRKFLSLTGKNSNGEIIFKTKGIMIRGDLICHPKKGLSHQLETTNIFTHSACNSI